MSLRNFIPTRQLSKFILVGILNTIVGYGAFLICLNYFHYIISMIISHIVGVLHSYVWNKYWTFKTERISAKEFIKFNSTYGAVLVTNTVALSFFVEILKIDPKIGALLVLPIVTLISYLGHKYWSFNTKT